MPVIQISEIVHRRGAKNSLPNLAEAEIGLSLDTSEVFIGTPNFPQAQNRAINNQFPFANTQILTEFSPNVEQLLNYTYRYRQPNGATEGTASPLALNSQRVIRHLQERLDEIVSVKSYGALGNGFLDFATVADLRTALTVDDPLAIQKETFAIRRAAIDVSNTLDDNTTIDGWVKRALYFPAGVYVIEDYAVLPPNSAWIGDGKGQTFIVLASATNANIPVVQTASSDLTLADLQNNLVDNFVGANITQYVSNIMVSGITFVHAWSQDVARLYRAKDCVFIDCGFENITQVTKTSGNWLDTDSVAVLIDTASGNMLPPQNLNFENCSFKNSTYAVFATSDSNSVLFDGCLFDGHYRAVRLGEPISPLVRPQQPSNINSTPLVAGPSAFRVTNSLFRNCAAEAFSVMTVNNIPDVLNNYQGVGGFHVSQNNRYENCGQNSRQAPSVPQLNPSQTPVIEFAMGSVYNVSISDTFDRNAPASIPAHSRVLYSTTDPNIVFNPQDPVFYPGSGVSGLFTATILASQLVPTDFAPLIQLSANNSVVFFNYSYKVSGTIRMGTLQIVSDGISVNFTDYSTQVGPPDPVILSVSAVNGGFYKVQYQNTAGVNGILKYNVRFWTAS